MADTAACSSSRNRSAGLLSASNLAARTAQPGANLRNTAFSACRTLHPGRCQPSSRTKHLRKWPKRSGMPKERGGIFSNTGRILVHVFQRRNPAGRVPADLSADAPLSCLLPFPGRGRSFCLPILPYPFLRTNRMHAAPDVFSSLRSARRHPLPHAPQGAERSREMAFCHTGEGQQPHPEGWSLWETIGRVL